MTTTINPVSDYMLGYSAANNVTYKATPYDFMSSVIDAGSNVLIAKNIATGKVTITATTGALDISTLPGVAPALPDSVPILDQSTGIQSRSTIADIGALFALNIPGLAYTVPANTDFVVFHDVSIGADRRAMVGDMVRINDLAAEVVIDSADEMILYDSSSLSNKKITFAAMAASLPVLATDIVGMPTEPAIMAADEFIFYDTSAMSNKKIDFASIAAGLTSSDTDNQIVAGTDSFLHVPKKRNLDLTQWSGVVGVAVANNTTQNIFELVSDADKILTPVNPLGELSITADGGGADFIQVNWQGTVEKISIRVILDLTQGGSDFFRLQLHRKLDDSIVVSQQFSMNSADIPNDIVTVNIETFVGTAADSFVTDGFYIALANNSGGTVTIAAPIDILIERSYQTPQLA